MSAIPFQHLELRWAALAPSKPKALDKGQKFLQDLDLTASTVSKVQRDASEGVGFFNRLLDYLTQLEQEVQDYVLARETEKQGLLSAPSAPQVVFAPPQGYGWR
jgi:hypothetical protein